MSFWRGLLLDVQVWGHFNWAIDYSHGFIKRGLAGTVFQSVFAGSSEAAVQRAVVVQHVFLCAALMTGLLVMAFTTLKRARGSVVVFALWFSLLTSQFAPTLAYNVGYLDVHLLSLLLLATIAIRFRRHGLASGLAAVGPFVHELFVFWWCAPAVYLGLRAWRERSRAAVLGTMGCLAAPALSLAAVMVLHSQGAVASELASAPLPPEMKDVLLNVQFGQTLEGAFRNMMNGYAVRTGNALAVIAYCLFPSVMAVALAAMHWRERPDRVLWTVTMALMMLAPASAVLFAWDLSRLLVITSFTAALAFWLLEGEHEATGATR